MPECNRRYLDGDALGGMVEDPTVAVPKIKTEGGNINVRMKAKNCELIINDVSVRQTFQAVTRDVLVVDLPKAVMIGAQLGGYESVEEAPENNSNNVQTSRRLP
jgi:hypothetical protein